MGRIKTSTIYIVEASGSVEVGEKDNKKKEEKKNSKDQTQSQ
jgi:hypothetical protein